MELKHTIFLAGSNENYELYMQVGAFYEVVSALVRRKALDKNLAVITFGTFSPIRWQTLEKAIFFTEIS